MILTCTLRLSSLSTAAAESRFDAASDWVLPQGVGLEPLFPLPILDHKEVSASRPISSLPFLGFFPFSLHLSECEALERSLFSEQESSSLLRSDSSTEISILTFFSRSRPSALLRRALASRPSRSEPDSTSRAQRHPYQR